MSSKAKKTKKRQIAQKVVTAPIVYPVKLVKPIAFLLRAQLKHLKKRRRELASEDPFKNVSRIADNAAPDADAEEQYGHARVSALKEQLDRKIIQTRRALTRIKLGKYGICERCGNMINTDRLVIYPEATLCVKCESKKSSK